MRAVGLILRKDLRTLFRTPVLLAVLVAYPLVIAALVGALAREARTASLVAVLIVLPIVFLGLIPSEFFAAAGWASDALPFSHGVRLFSATLFDLHPWGAIGRESAWLVALGLLYGGGSVLAVRTLRA